MSAGGLWILGPRMLFKKVLRLTFSPPPTWDSLSSVGSGSRACVAPKRQSCCHSPLPWPVTLTITQVHGLPFRGTWQQKEMENNRGFKCPEWLLPATLPLRGRHGCGLSYEPLTEHSHFLCLVFSLDLPELIWLHHVCLLYCFFLLFSISLDRWSPGQSVQVDKVFCPIHTQRVIHCLFTHWNARVEALKIAIQNLISSVWARVAFAGWWNNSSVLKL